MSLPALRHRSAFVSSLFFAVVSIGLVGLVPSAQAQLALTATANVGVGFRSGGMDTIEIQGSVYLAVRHGLLKIFNVTDVSNPSLVWEEPPGDSGRNWGTHNRVRALPGIATQGTTVQISAAGE